METDDYPLVIAAGSDLTRQLSHGDNALNLDGVNDCRRLLEEAGIGYGLFFVTPSYFKQALRFPPPAGKLLLNLISDADLNPKVLDVLERVLRDRSIQPLNHPARIRDTTRDRVAARLQGIPGLVVPRTLRLSTRNAKHASERVARSGLSFPGILRPVGTHGGHGARLVPDMDAMLAGLAEQRECYLTEFHDFVSGDGYYRKYRCFFIGESMVFRHLIISDNWSVHAGDRKRLMLGTDWMMAEEAAIHALGIGHFSAAQVETMRRVRGAMGLDYFGLDFSILPGGTLLLFEANATMNFFPFTTRDRGHYTWQCLPHAVAAIRDLVGGRLAARRR